MLINRAPSAVSLSIDVDTSIMRARSKHAAFFAINSTHIDSKSTARKVYWQPLIGRFFVWCKQHGT
jgi:hypothetical protein